MAIFLSQEGRFTVTSASVKLDGTPLYRFKKDGDRNSFVMTATEAKDRFQNDVNLVLRLLGDSTPLRAVPVLPPRPRIRPPNIRPPPKLD